MVNVQGGSGPGAQPDPTNQEFKLVYEKYCTYRDRAREALSVIDDFIDRRTAAESLGRALATAGQIADAEEIASELEQEAAVTEDDPEGLAIHVLAIQTEIAIYELKHGEEEAGTQRLLRVDERIRQSVIAGKDLDESPAELYIEICSQLSDAKLKELLKDFTGKALEYTKNELATSSYLAKYHKVVSFLIETDDLAGALVFINDMKSTGNLDDVSLIHLGCSVAKAAYFADNSVVLERALKLVEENYPNPYSLSDFGRKSVESSYRTLQLIVGNIKEKVPESNFIDSYAHAEAAKVLAEHGQIDRAIDLMTAAITISARRVDPDSTRRVIEKDYNAWSNLVGSNLTEHAPREVHDFVDANIKIPEIRFQLMCESAIAAYKLGYKKAAREIFDRGIIYTADDPRVDFSRDNRGAIFSIVKGDLAYAELAKKFGENQVAESTIKEIIEIYRVLSARIKFDDFKFEVELGILDKSVSIGNISVSERMQERIDDGLIKLSTREGKAEFESSHSPLNLALMEGPNAEESASRFLNRIAKIYGKRASELRKAA